MDIVIFYDYTTTYNYGYHTSASHPEISFVRNLPPRAVAALRGNGSHVLLPKFQKHLECTSCAMCLKFAIKINFKNFFLLKNPTKNRYQKKKDHQNTNERTDDSLWLCLRLAQASSIFTINSPLQVNSAFLNTQSELISDYRIFRSESSPSFSPRVKGIMDCDFKTDPIDSGVLK